MKECIFRHLVVNLMLLVESQQNKINRIFDIVYNKTIKSSTLYLRFIINFRYCL